MAAVDVVCLQTVDIADLRVHQRDLALPVLVRMIKAGDVTEFVQRDAVEVGSAGLKRA